jgi:glycerophosphoryl diester phosphodiesterase
MPVPLLVAHRGLAAEYPENTLEALRAALEAGACFVEFDVQLTADGVPVLLHDADLRRTGDRDESVLELSFAQLQRIEVNQRQVFGDRFGGLRVPRLAEAIELLVRWPRARAFVEVKPEGIERFGVEQVLEWVKQDLSPAPSRSILISSVDDLLAAARLSGQPEIGLVLREWTDRARRTVEALQPDYVLCNLRRIPAQIELWPGPWRWVIYEVVSPALAMELAERGADFIETMAIEEMLADPVLATRSCRG